MYFNFFSFLLVYSSKHFNNNLSCKNVKNRMSPKKYDDLKHPQKWLTSDSHDST